MAGKFQFRKFADIDLGDSFFDSLKADYPEFSVWYGKKAEERATALVFSDDDGLGSFVYLKEENESIELVERILPAVSRLKIGTFKLAERFHNQRLGEVALGLVLWQWRRKRSQEIYVTVFDKHERLIDLFGRFGFSLAGHKSSGECVYLRSRLAVDYSDPYKSFPFINPNFKKAGYILVNDYYHDTLFPYSELKGTIQDSVGISAANGMSKVYVGAQYAPHYNTGEPVFIYRIHKKNDGQRPRYKSCVTSVCVVTNIITVKTNSKPLISFDELLERIGNKSVFDENEMRAKYNSDRNLIVGSVNLYYN